MDLQVRPFPLPSHGGLATAQDIIMMADERYNSIPSVSKASSQEGPTSSRQDRRYQLTTKNSSRATMVTTTTAASSGRFSAMGDSDPWLTTGQSQLTLNSHATSGSDNKYVDEARQKRAEENAAFVRLLEEQSLVEGSASHNNDDSVSSPFQRSYRRRNYQDTTRLPSTSHTKPAVNGNRATALTSPSQPQQQSLRRQGHPMRVTGGKWLPESLNEADDDDDDDQNDDSHGEGGLLVGREISIDMAKHKKDSSFRYHDDGMDVPLNPRAKAAQQNRKQQQHSKSRTTQPQPQHEEFGLSAQWDHRQHRHGKKEQEQPQYPLGMALELADQEDEREAHIDTSYSKLLIFQPPQEEGDVLRLQCETAADEAAKAASIFRQREGTSSSNHPSPSSSFERRRATTGETPAPAPAPAAKPQQQLHQRYFPANTPRSSGNARGGSPPSMPKNVSRNSLPANATSRCNVPTRNSSRESLPTNLTTSRDSNNNSRRSPSHYHQDINVQCEYPSSGYDPRAISGGGHGYLYPSPPQPHEEEMPYKLLPPIAVIEVPTHWQGLDDGGTPDDDMLDLDDERPPDTRPPENRPRRRPPRTASYDTERSGLRTVLTTEPAYAQLTLEVSPGVHMPFRGSEETWKAISEGRIAKTGCVACTLHLYCVDDAEFVVCPECQTISPVIAADTGGKRRKQRSGGGGGGLGLGFLEEQLNKWQADMQ